MSHRSPTSRLLAGLAVTLVAVGVFSGYTLYQIAGLRELQAETIDRNRRDSLQLLRIQNDLNQLGLAMRDMLEGDDGYGIEAWRNEFDRIRYDLEDALRIEATLGSRPSEQNDYLARSLQQFWNTAEQAFQVAEAGDQGRARGLVVNSLEAQQASITSAVARLLVQNNEAELQAYREVQATYERVEHNIYLFIAAMVLAIAGVTGAIILANRRLFDRLASVSEQRSTLSRRLITVQEEVFRSVSRDLHDDFGQILTAVGIMLRRIEKRHVAVDDPLRKELEETLQVVQETLEKTRSFSQALHPTVLDDYGLERAVERYLPLFEKQTGIPVQLEKRGSSPVRDQRAIHVYRILQEALNNVAKHSGAKQAFVTLELGPEQLRLQVRDRGVGMNGGRDAGLGLIAMRERAEILHGALRIESPPGGGTIVTLEVPVAN